MQDSNGDIWQQIVRAIELQVSRDTFHRWFAGVTLLGVSQTEVVIGANNNIYQVWIEMNYLHCLESAITQVLGAPRKVRFVVKEDLMPGQPVTALAAGGVDSSAVNGSASGHPAVAAVSAQDIFPDAAQSPAPAFPAPERAESESPGNGLNPRNTFETFVVGLNNEYAQAACRAVANAPAKSYNPLFLYGGVGLGKTHLMQAIGHAMLARKKNLKVIYISSESFTNEFIGAIQHASLVKFRRKFRQADVLLIDDIQFLAGKERSQEEFFHTFNVLYDSHKQIVLSSDRPPSEMKNVEDRLVSRFEGGLTAELQPPDIETRQAILRKKAEAMSIKLSDEVFDFLAKSVRSNVRRLEGALMRVASFASLSGRALKPEQVEHLLKDILQEEARRSVTIDQIQRRVAEHYDVRLADMTSKRRPANIAFPRQVAMYLARELTKSSLNEIGEAFGGRDHGTVIHAHRRVKTRMAAEESTRRVVLMLDSQLQK